MKTSKKKTISTLARYAMRYWYLVLLALLFSAGYVFASLNVPREMGFAIDSITDLLTNTVQAETPGEHIWFRLPGMMEDPVLYHAGMLIVYAAIAGISQFLLSIVNNNICFRVARNIRKDAFDHLHVLPLKYLDSKPQGVIVNNIISDVDQITDGLLLGFTQAFSSILTILVTFVLLVRYNFVIALVVFVLTPLSLFVASYIAKKTYRFFGDQSKIRGEQTALIDEMISNQKTVQAYGYQQTSQDRFNEINDRLKETSQKAVFFSSLTNPTTRFANNVVYAIVAVIGAFMVISGSITVGAMTAILNYASQYTKPFNEISSIVTELQNALACAQKVFELMDEEPYPADDANAVDLEPVFARTDKKVGSVDVEHVTFSYVPEQKLIEDFNLSVKPGQRVAIVGPTGCGKTTLVNLLMRFYDVKEGCIMVEGNDIRNVTRKSLRNGYGMVLQDVWVRRGTIMENLTLGNPEATREEVIAAAKECHAHSFIKRLPQGYDTPVPEDGGNLSLGQKQLLCITRAMLSKPYMLILDEATSSIDVRTEIRVQKAFAKLMEGRTSFIVAHRLSTIKEADVILVMRDGNVVESGTHEELIRLGGFYKQLYSASLES